MSVVLRTQMAGAGKRPARLLLTGLAVLVASFVVYATVLAQQITERTILNGLSGTPESAALVLRDGDLNSADLAAIGKLPGVAEAAGRIESGVRTPAGTLILLADPGSGPLSRVTVREGRYPAATGEIAVTPRTVERMGFAPGATLTVDSAENEPVTLTVVGVVDTRDDYGYLAYVSVPTVRAVSDGWDSLQQIDVRLDAGADPAAVRQRIEPLVAGEGAPEIVTGTEARLAEAQNASGQVDELFIIVRVFVAVAVIAAGLIATSTFRIVFAQRMRQLALLRAVGAGRGALARALAAEGALTGLIAGITGVLAALAAGHLVPPAAGLFGVDLARPGSPFGPALFTVALAVLITVVAVLAPALSAARVAPLEALRSAVTTGARTGVGRLRTAAGLLLALVAAAIVAVVWVNLPERDAQDYQAEPMLLAVVGSGGLAFVALIALGPLLVRPVLAVTGWPLRRLGPIGRLAVGGVGGSIRRAAAVSVVVALGVTLITGTLVGADSVRVLADRETIASAPTDFEVSGPGGSTLPAGVIEKARDRGELTRVTPYRRVDGVTVGEAEVRVTDLSTTALPRLSQLDVAAGDVTGLAPGRIVVSGYLGPAVGDRVTVGRGGRTLPVTVVAVLGDSTPLGTEIVLDPADLTALGVPAAPTGLLADAAATGEDGRTAGLRALREVIAAQPDLGVQVLADQRDQVEDALGALLAVALTLIGLTVLIAVVGVGATSALSVVERARESGLLRAVGMPRGGLLAMLTTESALYGVIGAVLGLVLGVPYAWLAVLALGIDAPLTMPGGQLAGVFLALTALTALAGVLPARRAAKVSPVTALATD
ncbi:FtsX-like permease family protein [Actinoplanes sp. G11-F43]|uniref:FtsX-like permease family protein n=1 Tax=Actinoplanes sp. G11-F43 TaxID=3424130 RepID=UPI003D3486D3